MRSYTAVPTAESDRQVIIRFITEVLVIFLAGVGVGTLWAHWRIYRKKKKGR